MSYYMTHILCALKSSSFWQNISISLENLQIGLVTRRAIADRLEAMSVFRSQSALRILVQNEHEHGSLLLKRHI